MLVAVNGFGSIWTRRFGRHCDSVTRFGRDAAFYNTTGVPVGEKMRARSRVYGVTRFNGSSGFTPHHPLQMLNRVFECAEPCTRDDGRHVLFERLAATSRTPDMYLVTMRDELTGWIEPKSESWKSHECFLISFSQSDLHQEVMLLMAAFGWVRGSGGVFVLVPDPRRPARARLVGERG
jgi:hypothetical protein